MPTSHAEDIVVVYLPADKMVIEADHISPRSGQVRPAPLVKEFVAGLDKLGLDVATIVGIHGDSAPIASGPRRCPRRSAISRASTLRVESGQGRHDTYVTPNTIVPSVIATLIAVSNRLPSMAGRS